MTKLNLSFTFSSFIPAIASSDLEVVIFSARFFSVSTLYILWALVGVLKEASVLLVMSAP